MYYSNGLLASSSTSSVFLFGDDTKCLKPVCSISDCLSMKIDLLNLTTWSQHWNLNFNTAKCALLRFSSGCPPTAFNYILNGDLISAQDTHRDLGIILCLVISWRERMKNILSRAYKTLNLIRYSFISAWSQSSNQEDSLFAPSSFTAYNIILFTDLASPPSERHNNS